MSQDSQESHYIRDAYIQNDHVDSVEDQLSAAGEVTQLAAAIDSDTQVSLHYSIQVPTYILHMILIY